MNTRPSADPDTAQLSARIDAQLKHDLEELAHADYNRSLSKYVEMVLRQHVEAKKTSPQAAVKTA